MEKVKNASGANYSFHKEKAKAFIPQGKIVSYFNDLKYMFFNFVSDSLIALIFHLYIDFLFFWWIRFYVRIVN